MAPSAKNPSVKDPNDKVADGCGSSLNCLFNLDLITYAVRPITAVATYIVNDVEPAIFFRLRASPLLRWKFQLYANVP
jgi:hypothetical protein